MDSTKIYSSGGMRPVLCVRLGVYTLEGKGSIKVDVWVPSMSNQR